MKVLQINVVHKEKSTGRTCLEVNKALESKGYEGYVAYGKGKHNDSNTYRIGSEIDYYFHNIMSRITGLQGHFSFFATKRLIKYIKRISPDIIHLRNLHANYINLRLLFNFLEESDIPVVLNLHDCWTFTGKCTYYSDVKCNKWQTECNNCPVLKKYPQSLFFDKTTKLFNEKKRGFNSIKDLTVIGVSNWVADQAKMSFLSKRNISTVYNWINRDTFKPYNETIFKKYGIDSSKFTILGVSALWKKGTPRYEDFIKLANLISDDMQIVLVGQKVEDHPFPGNIKHIPYVENTQELAKFYSSADVYVHLSTEDTFGKVVAEAMACGTPAIVYNSTALPELIGEGCGFVVERRDVNEIYKSIQQIQFSGKDFYSESCINFVKDNFNYETNVQKLISIYESLINNKKVQFENVNK